MADEHADPFTVATDLLSQAEHGFDSSAVLITTSQTVGEKTIQGVNRLLKILPTADVAGISWNRLGEVVVVDNLEEAYHVANEYAFEHVQILTEKAPRSPRQDVSLRRSLSGREDLCVLRRQMNWNQPCLADSWRRKIYWGFVGGKVPENRHLPRGDLALSERRAWMTVWPSSSRGKFRRELGKGTE